MKTRLPPVLAAWAPRRWSTGRYRDALLGDLIEQYQTRGVMWFWRQTVVTILITRAQQLRLSKRRFVKFAATAFAVAALGAGTLTWARTITESHSPFKEIPRAPQ